MVREIVKETIGPGLEVMADEAAVVAVTAPETTEDEEDAS